ncbi:MAG TPA: hypothetical protein VMU92_06280 [Acidobacteriaceae bacterium]|nr:hypothetical protein [Acidobacteriaceae bacterium]
MSEPQNWNVNVPGDPNLPNVKVNDTVTIICEKDEGFTWCYTDDNDPQVFADGFLADGSYAKGTYGPYDAVNAGSISYDGVLGQDKPCTPQGARETVHTITVSS